MSLYEIWSLVFSFINILLFFYISYSFQKNFSNENKIKEILNSKLNNLIKLIEILDYSEEKRNEYLVNKRKISNILYNISRKKIYSKIDEIQYLLYNLK